MVVGCWYLVEDSKLLKFPIFTNILKCLTVSKLQKC